MAQTIYINGNIITMDDSQPTVEALVQKGGAIAYVGDNETALSYKSLFTKVVDLGGKTMVPGFIDGHSHFFYSSIIETLVCNLSHPPLGDIESIDDIIQRLKDFIVERNIKPGKIVMGMGYDQSLLKDGRIPTRDDLDQVSTEHPVAITHQSGHVAVFNSYILNELGIDDDTPDPDGGSYGRYKGTTKPNGIAEETAMMSVQIDYFPKPSFWDLRKVFKNGQRFYAENGITTAQDGGLKKLMLLPYKVAKWFRWLDIDVFGYWFADKREEVREYLDLKASGKTTIGKMNLFGIKVLLDGSPQAKTAWLTEPYHVVPDDKSDDYRGYPMIPNNAQVEGIYDEVVKHKLQVLTHTNGDAASDQLINAYEKAVNKHHPNENLRPVMIHAQTVRKDQLERMVPIGMIPSFFQMHTYFWGDWHLDSVLGPTRGHNISPTRWAADLDIKFNVHCDTPVLPPHTAYMLWTAVNRKTRSGRTIGADHRLTVTEALKAQTIWAAYAYFEEDRKGSLEVGKEADLAILDRDPLTIPEDDLRHIQVLETIKAGKTIYKRKQKELA